MSEGRAALFAKAYEPEPAFGAQHAERQQRPTQQAYAGAGAYY